MTARWGLLLVNLGTPDAPETAPVRKYLDEFLSDPRVIDIAAWKRWLLLNLIILRTRPKESAEAYQSVWTERGSPLLFHGQDLAAGVQELLGEEVKVVLAMRYQTPSIEAGLAELRAAGIDHVVALPLYPQYASSSTGSTVEKLYAEAGKHVDVFTLSVVPAFYDHPAFVGAFAEVARPVLAEAKPDKVLFSFHGLPERHLRSGEVCGRACFQPGCCDSIRKENRTCYKAQSYATARALAAALELPEDGWEVAFQSRLGRDPWITPYTDHRINELPEEGVKKLAVLVPSFVADCLETIEEIGIRGRDDFKEHGGEELTLVPSLNAHPAWVEAVAKIARQYAPSPEAS
ncbi:MAG TPA: ferrochelatase [Planctomycetes bacterium]|nr:ferrochelatase [Planctomycetota bacterium]